MRGLGKEGEEPGMLMVQNYQMQYIKRDTMDRKSTNKQRPDHREPHILDLRRNIANLEKDKEQRARKGKRK